MQREGIKVAKCTVERLMRTMGLAGVRRGKTCVTTVSNPKSPCPLDRVNPVVVRDRESLSHGEGGQFNLLEVQTT